MNWFGSGFITIINYASISDASGAQFQELLTEVGINILTESSLEILTEASP